MTTGPEIQTLKQMAASVPDGSLLGVPADYSGVPMALTRELVCRDARELNLFCLPLTTIQGDLLIGAGCVKSVEAAAVTLGEFGLAPQFSKAVEQSNIEMRDSTCPALHAQLQASEKSVPFMPLRGILGSDILNHRPDWMVIENPFSNSGEPIVILPATLLDVSIFHAPYADRNGNVWIGRRRELATLVHASKRVLVTVEEILDEDFFESEARAAGALPAFYIESIAEARNGAWPCGLLDLYEPDAEELRYYAKAAKSDKGFSDYVRSRVFDQDEVA